MTKHQRKLCSALANVVPNLLTVGLLVWILVILMGHA